ncbi:MAG: hypothetical protein NTAFB01_32910 [Nitrospira sp.]
MSVTSADGRESVSAQCLKGEAYSFSPTRPALLLAALPRWYVEALSDAKTPLADFLNCPLIDEANSFKRDRLAQARIELKQNRAKHGRS